MRFTFNQTENYRKSKMKATESVIEIKIEEHYTFFQKKLSPIVS